MSNDLTIAWMTSRKDACWNWFCDSLNRETAGNYDGIHVMAIDYWANPHGGTRSMHEDRRGYILNALRCYGDQFQWASPKASPWQGPCRMTREDWFAAANARNTAVALCKTEWIAYVDDLSVLQPGWLTAVFNAMRSEKTVTCGAYRKVRDMTVVDGEVVKWNPHLVDNGHGVMVDAGLDTRLKHATGGRAVPAEGNWMFGCSLVAPVEAFLSCNGWDERCDGMGSEDYCTGINLAKCGWKFRYDPNMMTFESEERHHVEGQFKRSDYGVSPNDKSHAMLKLCQTGDGHSPVDFGGGDLRRLREKVANRQPFPPPPRDYREWFTGKRLDEL